MTGPSQKRVDFDLIANARDSLAHAVGHLTEPGNHSLGRWKVAIREVAHVIELLLKERLRQIHPAFVWVKIDEYPSLDAPKVGSELAATRLARLGGILLPKSALQTLDACRKLRNKIEHYEFQLNEPEAKGIVGRLLSFIFGFSQRHLGRDLEAEFREDDEWKVLIEIHEFREARSRDIEVQFAEEKIASEICPSCGEPTFHVVEERCHLCGHVEERVKCDHCHNDVWASDSESYDEPEYHTALTICNDCIDRSSAEDAMVDALREEQALREIES